MFTGWVQEDHIKVGWPGPSHVSSELETDFLALFPRRESSAYGLQGCSLNQLGLTLESWPNWESTFSNETHLPYRPLEHSNSQKQEAWCWRGRKSPQPTYALDACILTDSWFSGQPLPAACCQSRDGWLIATFVQVPRLKKNLDEKSGDGVKDCNKNKEYSQAKVSPKWSNGALSGIVYL